MSMSTMTADGYLFKSFRKGKVNFPWLPPLQLQKPSDWLVLSKCSPSMVSSLELIREGLMLLESPAFASMRLNHIPGAKGESGRQVGVYCNLKGWRETMKEKNMDKQARCTELYAKGFTLREIEQETKTKNGKARFHIVKGLEEYSFMFLVD